MARNVKWNKRLAFDWPGQQRALQNLGELGANLLDARINHDGVDSDGRPLPNVQGGRRRKGWFYTSKSDPRTVLREGGEPRNTPGSEGANDLVVNRGGYASVKARAGGKPWKGSSLTGAMWKSLTIRQTGRPGRLELKLYFAGSQRVGKARFRNRDKARLLQYADRASGQGFEPAGQRQFVLMAFSAGELRQLAVFWVQQVRIFKPPA